MRRHENRTGEALLIYELEILNLTDAIRVILDEITSSVHNVFLVACSERKSEESHKGRRNEKLFSGITRTVWGTAIRIV